MYRLIFTVLIIVLTCGIVIAQDTEVTEAEVEDNGVIELDATQAHQLQLIFKDIEVLQEREAKLRAQFALVSQSIPLNAQQLQDKDRERVAFLASVGAKGRFSLSADFKTLTPQEE